MSSARELPDFELANWDGRSVSPATLRGKTVIAAFTYAKCVFACPMVTFLLRELDADLARPEGLVYLHVSVNPEADTAQEILLHFKKHDIDPRDDPRWLFVNAPRDGVARLLKDAGIEVQHTVVEGGVLTRHTILVLVLGPDGKTLARFDTYQWDRKEMLHALRTGLGSSGSRSRSRFGFGFGTTKGD